MSNPSRQRPKVASYTDRHVVSSQQVKKQTPKTNLAIPKKKPDPGDVNSKRVRQASSGKPTSNTPARKVDETGGKMTKFKSLDDIPDMNEDYVPSFKDDDDDYDDQDEYYDDEPDDYGHKSHQQQRQSDQYQCAPPSSSHPPPLPVERFQQHSQPPLQSHNRQQQRDYDEDECDDDYGGGYDQRYDDNGHGDFDDDEDDWSEDSEPEVPPLPAQRRQAAGKSSAVVREKSQQRGGGGGRNTGVRQPSPIVYDESAVRGGRSVASRDKPYTEEEKLYYDRQPREVEYKPYTIKEYRRIKPQGYQELGKLKPDLNTDELVAKRANAERVKEFSKNLKKFNKEAMPRKDPQEMEIAAKQKKAEENSKRDKAREFAKNIPKPKIRVNSGGAGGGRARGSDRSNVGMSAIPVESNRLEELTSKHMQSRKQVDAIKKSLGL